MGLALWLDASDAATINTGSPVDGDPVSAWADKSVSGFDAAQAVANNQPVYKAAIQNGLSVVRFDPTSFVQYVALSGAGLGLFRNLPGLTIALLCRVDPPGDSYVFAASANGSTANKRVLMEVYPGTPTELYFACSLDDSADALNYAQRYVYDFTAVPNTPLLHVGVSACDAGAILLDSPLHQVQDQADDSWNQSPGNTEDTDSDAITLGCSTDQSQPLSGDVCELVVYQRALNMGERRQLLEYLSAKWATL